jgi:23S rRNA (guanine745-N1)-methyltransferase
VDSASGNHWSTCATDNPSEGENAGKEISLLREVIDFLRCPNCGRDLALEGKSVCCAGGHTFDVARQGYVNLIPGGGATSAGDTASMVAAREAFLEAGHFAPLTDRVAEAAVKALSRRVTGCVVDVGAGTGHYLTHVMDRTPDHVGLALDVSKYAARRAARTHPRIGAVVCDAWRSLPIHTGVAAVVLNVFSPRSGAECHRILNEEGAMIVVTPTSRHLEELVGALGLVTVDEDKAFRVHAQLDPYFDEVDTSLCEFSMTLGSGDIQALVEMGPSAWHVDADALAEQLEQLALPVAVTASVTVSVYSPT